ncbi:aspartic peptidase domain-containing protein [Helicostylum pulchrum]|nr:aspartic peptidase domain-containing protein [Helicostylum pulchrum]
MKIQYAAGLLISLAATNAAFAQEEEVTLLRVPMTKKHARGIHHKRDANLYNDYGSIYLIDVQVGTPPQHFELALDTGSADLWIPGSLCPNSVCPLARFNEKSSTTFVPSNEAFNITYGIGNAHGTYATETVTIAGATVENQKFGYVDTTENILTEVKTLEGSTYTPTISSGDNSSTYGTDFRMDGIFGLGYPFLTASVDKPYNPFFFNLKAQNKISKNIFSIFLNNSESYGNSGEIIFGGIDESKYTGEISYLPVVKTDRRTQTLATVSDFGFWQVYGQGISVKNGIQKDIQVKFDNTVPFVFDTGTTLSYLPTSVLEPIIDAAVGKANVAYDKVNNYFQIRCSMAKENTRIEVVMSTTAEVTTTPVTMSVPIADLIFPMDTEQVSTASVCMFGIVPTAGTIFIGESLLRSVYQVYDAELNRIGIAGAVSSNATVTNVGGKNTDSNSNDNGNNNKAEQGTSKSSITKSNTMITLIGLVFTLYLI